MRRLPLAPLQGDVLCAACPMHRYNQFQGRQELSALARACAEGATGRGAALGAELPAAARANRSSAPRHGRDSAADAAGGRERRWPAARRRPAGAR